MLPLTCWQKCLGTSWCPAPINVILERKLLNDQNWTFPVCFQDGGYIKDGSCFSQVYLVFVWALACELFGKFWFDLKSEWAVTFSTTDIFKDLLYLLNSPTKFLQPTLNSSSRMHFSVVGLPLSVVLLLWQNELNHFQSVNLKFSP